MVNFLQIDELISRRWPTQRKEEKIQQEYSSFSEKIHNNLEDSLEQTSIQKEAEIQKSSVFQQPVKLTVQIQGEAVSSFSQKIHSTPFTSEELAESTVQKITLNQQSFLGKNMLTSSGDSTAEPINTAKLLQEDSKIPSVDSGVTQSKQAFFPSKHPGIAEKEALKERVASAEEIENAAKLLQEESEISSVVDSVVTESKLAPQSTKHSSIVEKEVLKESVTIVIENAAKLLQEESETSSIDSEVSENKQATLLSRQHSFVKREFVENSENGDAESLNSMQLLQEGAEYTLSRNLNAISLADTEYKENRQEQTQPDLQPLLEKVTVKETKEEETDSLKLQRLVQEEFAPEISSQSQNPAKLMRLFQERPDYSLSEKMNSASLTRNGLTEGKEEQGHSSFRFSLEKKSTEGLQEEGGELAKLVRAFQKGKSAALFQKTDDVSLVNTGWTSDKQGEIPSKQQDLDRERTKEPKVVQGANSRVLPKEVLENPLVTAEVLENAGVQLPPKQEGLDELKSSVKEAEAEVAESAKLVQEASRVVLPPGELEDFVVATEVLETANVQQPPKQEGLDTLKSSVKEAEVAEPAKLVQEASGVVLSQGELADSVVTTEVLQTANVQQPPKQEGLDTLKSSVKEAEVAEPAKLVQEASRVVLSQGELADSVITTEVLQTANVQQPPKQDDLDTLKSSVNEAEVAEPAKLVQEARNVVLPPGELADFVVTTEVLEAANVQQPPKQEGLDTLKPSVKAAEVLEPAGMFQETRNAALPPGELADPVVMTEVLESAGVQQPPKQEDLDKPNPSMKEPQEKVAELVNSTQLFQEIVRTPFINGKAIEAKEGSGLFNLKNSLEKRFAEIGKGKAGKSENSKSLSEEETKEVTAVLLDLSNQVLALQQLQGNSASFSEISQMLGQLFSDYGNIRVQELPPKEMQKLTTHLQAVGTGQLIVNTNISIGQILSQWTADVSDAQLQTEQVNLFSYSKESFGYEGTEKIDGDTIKDKKEQETVTSSFTESLSGALEPTSKAMRVQGHESIKHENILSSDLDKKLKQKVEEIQKFVVKNERIFLQLNPERFGTVEVYLKKQQDSIQVHVQTNKEETQKQLDIIFEDIKAKLKEQDIQIEITYTERERQERQEQRGEQREQEYTRQQHQEQEKQPENPFKQLWEGIEND